VGLSLRQKVGPAVVGAMVFQILILGVLLDLLLVLGRGRYDRCAGGVPDAIERIGRDFRIRRSGPGIRQRQRINHAEIGGVGVGRDAKLLAGVIVIFGGQVRDAEGSVE